MKALPVVFRVIVMLGVTLLPACRHGREEAPANAPLVAVRTQVVRRAASPVIEEIVGTVRSALIAAIAAKVSASVETMRVAPGQMVTAGYVIATLHAAEIQARYDQTVAMHDQARQDFERFTKLREQKVASQYDYDNAQTRFRTAQAALDETRTMLRYTQIQAPFDGVITRKFVDQGDFATPGRAIVEIENPQALRLEAEVPETAVNRLRLGEGFRVRVDAAKLETNAPISEIAPSGNQASRTFLVKFDLPRDAQLHPNQFGRVSIPVGEEAVLRVPAPAVVVRGQLELVFVVSGSNAVMRIVRTGRRISDDITILSGLDDGETIVSAGAEQLRDGQPLRLQ